MVNQLVLNSLELAAELAEPHYQVLQCVDGLIADGMERSRFREARYLDAAGVERRCVEMTKEAIVLVSMRLGAESRFNPDQARLGHDQAARRLA
jgi:phage regulator Rha-like protein